MDLGGREILIALGALLLLAILLDGFRRMRSAGQGKLRVKRRRQPIFDEDAFEEFGSELPSGKARVVGFRDEDSAEQLSRTIKQSRELNENKLTAPFRKPVQSGMSVESQSLEDEPVAIETLTETLPESELQDLASVKTKVESDSDSQTSLFAEEPIPGPVDASDEKLFTTGADDNSAVIPTGNAAKKSRKSKPAKTRTTKTRSRKTKPSTQNEVVKEAPTDNDEVVVLHLMAEQGKVFQGNELLKAVVDHGLRYGALKIFHRHVREDGSGDVLFSMANSVNPGTFELNSMDEFSTPGVTFMMVLEDSEDPLATFDLMLESIHGIHTSLGGELKDQQRSALSRQTAEHYRQQIMDFNRRRLAAGV